MSRARRALRHDNAADPVAGALPSAPEAATIDDLGREAVDHVTRHGNRPQLRPAALAGAIAVAGFLFGFVLFANAAMRQVPAGVPSADAIVVLTGGQQRIEAGLRLLAAGKGRRLLISGVNPRSGKEDIRRLTRFGPTLFECCVDLGYSALDTTGNAEEARGWAASWRFQSLIVVTASYHMPRGMVELMRALPGTRLIPFPVLPASFRGEPWWLSPPTTRILAAEYLKLLPSAAMLAASRLTRQREQQPQSTNVSGGSHPRTG